MNLKETLDWYVKEGYLVAIHNGNLTLYDYTNQCALKGNWNYHTRMARGLVLNDKSDIISKPLPKFFNLNEGEAHYLQNLPQEPAEVADKLDGSLVIIFKDVVNDRWMATTRRSWNNHQTKAAYRWLEKNRESLHADYTYCFELIAPWNKIVVDYDSERFVLIGMTDLYGNDLSYAEIHKYADQNGLEAVSYVVQSIDSIDPNYISENSEGYVARWSNGLRVKIKGTWYLEKHEEMSRREARDRAALWIVS